MMLVAGIVGLTLAALPVVMIYRNLPLFLLPLSDNANAASGATGVSVLIPARDEQASIEDTVTAVLASQHVSLEVVVLDDHSTDATAEIVARIAATDQRVRYAAGKPLPDGWNGKQFACHQLTQLARYPNLVFLDADVPIKPQAIAELLQQKESRNVALLSAFPHQRTETWAESAIVPLMYVILLGYLPLWRMRSSTHPSYAAGCGQLFLTDRPAYERSGGHAAIRATRHDGIELPRAYRNVGMRTDVVDGASLASCRMYHGASEVVRGVLKNATEGIAHPKRIVPFSILLLGANVIPLITLATGMVTGQLLCVVISAAGVVLGHIPRWVIVDRFNQSLAGVFLHVPAVACFVALQWIALVQSICGIRIAWRGRSAS